MVTPADWRVQLTIGSRCDAQDRVGQWYSATIKSIETDPTDQVKKFNINFDGWSDNENELIARFAEKLQVLVHS